MDFPILLSKHFVFKSSLFSVSKKLLTVRSSTILLDSIPFSISAVESIEFNEIVSVQANPKNEKDFSIVFQKKNNKNSQWDLSSNNRAGLLADIYFMQVYYIIV